MDKNNEYLTRAQVAEILGIKPSSVSMLVYRGQLKCGKTRHGNDYTMAAVEAYQAIRRGRGRPRKTPKAD